jgi:hypothetical protein
MTHSTFIGPDGSTIGYRHGENCDCAECDTARWMKIEARETARCIIGIEQAWRDLQAVPSYVEREAK